MTTSDDRWLGEFASVMQKLGDRLDPQLREFATRITRALRGKDLNEAEAVVTRYAASLDSSDEKKRSAWRHVGDMYPAEAAAHWRFLPDPLKKRGRRKGGQVAPAVQLDLIDALVSDGMKPTTAARIAIKQLRDHVPGTMKNRADYLVRLWKKRAK